MTSSFDTFPLIYQLITNVSVLVLGGWLFLSASLNVFPEKLFGSFAAVCLLFLRLPVLVFNRELNADESQMLAQAMTLTVDPVYWHSVDGTTGGPLSSYFLALVGLVAGRFDYITAHIGAFILVLITLFFLYRAFRNWFGPFQAALGIFPAILFYGFTKFPDFVHYSSEHVPVALLALGLWLISSPLITRPSVLRFSAGLGVVLALIPFGKIQAVPFGAILAVFSLFLFYQQQAWRSFVYCLLGGLATYLLLAVLLAVNGVLTDFFTYYIQANFLYKNDTSLWQNIQFQLSQSLKATDMVILLIPLAGFLILRCFHKSPPFTPEVFALGIGLLIAGIFAISRTGSGYLHYLLFMVIPLSILTACLATSAKGLPNIVLAGYLGTPLVSSLLAVGLAYHETGVLNPFPSQPGQNREIPFTETGIAASNYLSSDEYLVVWGWNCQYYVECKAPQGVAENHSIRSVFEHVMRDTYRDRYLSDMRRTQPAVFIDATGKNSLWLQDTLTQSYRSFPQLAQYIDQNYTLAGTPDGNRLFVRNDVYKKQ